MNKNKHHFVPRFYLKGFRSNPERINLYNFKKNQALQDVGIKGQCYKHRFYGSTPEIENSLASIESTIAPIIHQIIKLSTLPTQKSNDYEKLIYFVALQMVRTTSSVYKMNTSIEKLNTQIFGQDKINLQFPNLPVFMLSMAEKIMYYISDLRLQLLSVSGKYSFITSDNPICKYNQHYETSKDIYMIGPLCRGLQIFFPISPKHLLCLYDSSVYYTANKQLIMISENDVFTLNLLQTIGAYENIYFHSWNQKNYIFNIVKKTFNYRIELSEMVKINEFTRVDNPQKSLIHIQDAFPKIQPSFSFINTKYKASRLSEEEKLHPKYCYRQILTDG